MTRGRTDASTRKWLGQGATAMAMTAERKRASALAAHDRKWTFAWDA
jgi:hypothetical protein